MNEEKELELDLDAEEFKRILAFLLIFDEREADGWHPNYIIEKYIRYIKNPCVPDEYLWGLHRGLRQKFDSYCKKYGIPIDKEEQEGKSHER